MIKKGMVRYGEDWQRVIVLVSLLGLLIISSTSFAAQLTDKTGDEPLRVVDLEIHTHTLSDSEISNIGHFSVNRI